MKRNDFVILMAAAIFAVAVNFAYADFVGMDQNGDLACDPAEMSYQFGAGDVGAPRTIDVFFDDLPAPIVSFGCLFCVQDKTLLAGETFTYAVPPEWSPAGMNNSEDDPWVAGVVSPQIPATYPDYKCYVIDATDFTFTHPITVFPVSLGTFEFEVAGEGCLGFIFDGLNTAYLTTGFVSYVFDDPATLCGPFDCGPTATEEETWGNVKTLFR